MYEAFNLECPIFLAFLWVFVGSYGLRGRICSKFETAPVVENWLRDVCICVFISAFFWDFKLYSQINLLLSNREMCLLTARFLGSGEEVSQVVVVHSSL